MNEPVFVTAIYGIYGEERPQYCDELWARFAFLVRHLPTIHAFCSLADASRLSALPNVIPHFVEFTDLDTYRALAFAHGLPDKRNTVKDSKEFMILMNAKPEFLRRTREAVPTASHYIWIDAGIQKILHTVPSDALTRMVARCHALCARETTGRILLPGIDWKRRNLTIRDIARKVLWRFCGGFCVVPAEYVDDFARETAVGAQEILRATGKLTWEVNVWAYMESRLPIRWYGCGWNQSIFDLPTE
jgi:hypothetical protein